ncbi:hypothetical protein FRC05_000226 [Tulasnella sp. 425]|nr:hypothetical protein FRC05_000226 [Tulasnella sp. 425]
MDVSGIAGNVPDEDKARVRDAMLAKHPKGSFADWIAERLKLAKVETTQDDNAPGKIIYRVVHELEACDEMDNGGGSVHGGCIAHLGAMSGGFLRSAYLQEAGIVALSDTVPFAPFRGITIIALRAGPLILLSDPRP